jgi:hypothetical protein
LCCSGSSVIFSPFLNKKRLTKSARAFSRGRIAVGRGRSKFECYVVFSSKLSYNGQHIYIIR